MPDLSSSQLFWSPDVSYVCLSVCKLFIFTSSDEEPLGQIQPNMTQSILAWSVIKFIQMKSLSLFLIMYLLIWTNQVSDVAHGSIVFLQVVKPFGGLTRSQGLMSSFRNIQGQTLTKRYSASQELLIKLNLLFNDPWDSRVILCKLFG